MHRFKQFWAFLGHFSPVETNLGPLTSQGIRSIINVEFDESEKDDSICFYEVISKLKRMQFLQSCHVLTTHFAALLSLSPLLYVHTRAYFSFDPKL